MTTEKRSIYYLWDQFDSSILTRRLEAAVDNFLEENFKGVYCWVRRRISDKKVFVELCDFSTLGGKGVIALLEFHEGESLLQEIITCVKVYLIFRSDRELV